MLPANPDPSPGFESLRGQAHVWFARPEDFRNEVELARYRTWLSDEERARADRYLSADDRHLFLVAHALLRSTLSRYGRRRPEEWQFTTGEHGRPELIGESVAATRPGFSLSHTHGLVACLVSDEVDCGVDVEGRGRVADPRGLAARYFSRAERDALDALPDTQVDTRFLEYWTLKEAYVKARGLGLELPLDGFRFTFEGRRPIGVVFGARIPDQAQRWQFEQCRPGPGHVLAVAVRRGGGGIRKVVVRRALPEVL